jgi:hypothetical protein
MSKVNVKNISVFTVIYGLNDICKNHNFNYDQFLEKFLEILEIPETDIYIPRRDPEQAYVNSVLNNDQLIEVNDLSENKFVLWGTINERYINSIIYIMLVHPDDNVMISIVKDIYRYA